MSRTNPKINSGDVRNAIVFTSLVGAALLAAASNAQPTSTLRPKADADTFLLSADNPARENALRLSPG